MEAPKLSGAAEVLRPGKAKPYKQQALMLVRVKLWSFRDGGARLGTRGWLVSLRGKYWQLELVSAASQPDPQGQPQPGRPW